MTRVLITGMSGTGKSSVIRELAARGYRAHDLDTPEWSEWIDTDRSDTLTPGEGKDWVWQESRVRALLSQPTKGTQFIGGCAENMTKFATLIDLTVLLSAPAPTLMERLKRRTPGEYGHTATDREKVAALIPTVEPLLRAKANHEIDASKPGLCASLVYGFRRRLGPRRLERARRRESGRPGSPGRGAPSHPAGASVARPTGRA